MTNFSAEELMKTFPMFDIALANFIHEHAETRIFEAGEILMKPGQFFKYAMLIVNG
jgi:CRP/FNR family transcriptional regulator